MASISRARSLHWPKEAVVALGGDGIGQERLAIRRLGERGPDQARAHQSWQRLRSVARGLACAGRERAASIAAEAPAMIQALNCAAAQCAARQRHVAVGAAIDQHGWAVSAVKHYDRHAHQTSGKRFSAELPQRRDRMPPLGHGVWKRAHKPRSRIKGTATLFNKRSMPAMTARRANER